MNHRPPFLCTEGCFGHKKSLPASRRLENAMQEGFMTFRAPAVTGGRLYVEETPQPDQESNLRPARYAVCGRFSDPSESVRMIASASFTIEIFRFLLIC